MHDSTLASHEPLRPSQIADLRLAASKMTGATRRAFQAEMPLKDCGGDPLLAETICGWGRHTVAVGLAERRTGITGLGAQAAFSGRKPWEDTQPEVAEALRRLAAAHAQPAPTFRTTLAYTRLTAQGALAALQGQGYREDQWPSPSTMAAGLNRLGFRLRTVVQAKPQKKMAETAANGKRVSSDCKAMVLIGDVSRGGLTRGDNRACDHDLGLHEKYIPWGIVEEERGQRHITVGSSSKTRDCLVDALEAWWAALEHTEQVAMARLQIHMDNGPESSGKRTPFLQRMVAFCEALGTPMQLLYYPPYHSKYHLIERCWGILEVHWNGTKLGDVRTMVEWAKTMPWKGMHPIVELSHTIYQKGMALGKAAMQAVEARLERHPTLPKYDIVIKPVLTS